MMKGRIWGKKKKWIKIFFNNGLLGLITVPPHPTVEHITLLLNPEELNKIAFSPWRLPNYFLLRKNMGVPWMSMAQSTPQKIMVPPLKNFMKIKSSPPNNWIISYIVVVVVVFFNSTPKKIPSFCYLPLKNSICPQPEAEGMDIKTMIPLWW